MSLFDSLFDSRYKEILTVIAESIKELEDFAAESTKSQHELKAAMQVQEDTLRDLGVRVQSLETEMPEEETQKPGERARGLFGVPKDAIAEVQSFDTGEPEEEGGTQTLSKRALELLGPPKKLERTTSAGGGRRKSKKRKSKKRKSKRRKSKRKSR